MKKVTIYIVAVVTSFTACNLDPEAMLSLTDDQVSTYSNTLGRLNNLYTYLPDGLSYIDNSMMAAASDEAEFTIETSAIQKFNTGAWNAIDNPDGAWSRNFNGIYAANLFLANSDSINLDYIKNDPDRQELYQTYLKNMKRWKYEARFLRAYYYSELVKRYGGVPIITQPISINDYTSNQRDSLSKCIRFIVEECDHVAANLPYFVVAPNDTLQYGDGDLGRATRGAALALKSRVLLYAASDLFNDPSWAEGYPHPEYISMADGKDRIERWEEAAQAAADLINENVYRIHTTTPAASSYADVFKTYINPEVIFARRYEASNSFERRNYPIGYQGAEGGLTPLGNLVDDYQQIEGGRAVAFDWNNPAHAADPYGSRDPRLRMSVVTNNALFGGGGEERPVEIWEGGRDGKGVSRATRTGYYTNKYIDSDLDLLQNRTSVHSWVLFRYSEVLLNYAEAAYEAYGGLPTSRAPNTSETVRGAINRVRGRANALMPPISNTAVGLKEAIRLERKIELAFEDHRLWDVRRWMTAAETLGVPARGVEVTKIDDETFIYTPVELENRVWHNKMYFYPIPQKEVEIERWSQNPLW